MVMMMGYTSYLYGRLRMGSGGDKDSLGDIFRGDSLCLDSSPSLCLLVLSLPQTCHPQTLKTCSCHISFPSSPCSILALSWSLLFIRQSCVAVLSSSSSWFRTRILPILFSVLVIACHLHGCLCRVKKRKTQEQKKTKIDYPPYLTERLIYRIAWF